MSKAIRLNAISGPLLRAWRDKSGKTRAQFAEETGISENQIQKLESGVKAYGEKSILGLDNGVPDGAQELITVIQADKFVLAAMMSVDPVTTRWAKPVQRPVTNWLVRSLSDFPAAFKFWGIYFVDGVELLQSDEQQQVKSWLLDGIEALEDSRDSYATLFRSYAAYILSRCEDPQVQPIIRSAHDRAIGLAKYGAVGPSAYDFRSLAISASFAGDTSLLNEELIPLMRKAEDLREANSFAILPHWYGQRTAFRPEHIWTNNSKLTPAQLLETLRNLIDDMTKEKPLRDLHIFTIDHILASYESSIPEIIRASTVAYPDPFQALPAILNKFEEDRSIGEETRHNLYRIRERLGFEKRARETRKIESVSDETTARGQSQVPATDQELDS